MSARLRLREDPLHDALAPGPIKIDLEQWVFLLEGVTQRNEPLVIKRAVKNDLALRHRKLL